MVEVLNSEKGGKSDTEDIASIKSDVTKIKSDIQNCDKKTIEIKVSYVSSLMLRVNFFCLNLLKLSVQPYSMLVKTDLPL